MRSLPRLYALLLLIGFAPLAAAETSVDFTKDVAPILQANCYGCHGETKGLGGLRLNTVEEIKAGAENHSDLLLAGKPEESELYERLVLPADDRKRMPKNADPLAKKDIEIIKQWIADGAEFTTAEAPTAKAAMDESPAEAASLPERPQLEAASPDAIAAAEETGALVIPLYSGSNELRVSFPSSRDQVTDETVAKLVPLAGQLVELDLSGTKITDGVAKSLQQLKNLDTLHLEKTEVGDATVLALTEMPYLHYLNLHSTKATDASLEALKSVPSLRKLYMWQTTASYEAAKALEKSTPGLEVNLGWDHPGVVRERLTSELTRVEEQQAEAVKTIEEAKKTLAEAEADQKSASDRAAEIKKQLEELNKPAEQPAESADKPAEGEAA